MTENSSDRSWSRLLEETRPVLVELPAEDALHLLSYCANRLFTPVIGINPSSGEEGVRVARTGENLIGELTRRFSEAMGQSQEGKVSLSLSPREIEDLGKDINNQLELVDFDWVKRTDEVLAGIRGRLDESN